MKQLLFQTEPFRRLQDAADPFCKVLTREQNTCGNTAADPAPSCYAAKSPAYCSPEESFDLLIRKRSQKIQSDLTGAVMDDGFWAALLEDKAAAYIFSAELGHKVPEVFCCVTDANDLEDCPGLDGPVVIKGTEMHSNAGVFVFPDGLSNDSASAELLSGGTMYTLADIISAFEGVESTKILVEEFVNNQGALPTEYKVHMFDGEVGSIDIIANRGTGCDCYAVFGEECERLDIYG